MNVSYCKPAQCTLHPAAGERANGLKLATFDPCPSPAHLLCCRRRIYNQRILRIRESDAADIIQLRPLKQASDAFHWEFYGRLYQSRLGCAIERFLGHLGTIAKLGWRSGRWCCKLQRSLALRTKDCRYMGRDIHPGDSNFISRS